MRDIGSEKVKLLCDTYHMNIEEKDIADSLYQAGDKLGHVHFADSNRFGPGYGHIPFQEIVQTLKKTGYDGQQRRVWSPHVIEEI